MTDCLFEAPARTTRTEWGLRHPDGHVTACHSREAARQIRQTRASNRHLPSYPLTIVSRQVEIVTGPWTEADR